MKFNASLLNELSELVILSLDDVLDKEKQQRLEELLERDALARKYYFRLINTYLGVREPGNLKVLHGHGQNVPYDIELWKALAKHETTAPAFPIEKPSEEQNEPGGVPLIMPARPERRMSRFSVLTLMLSTAAMMLIAAMVLFKPVYPIVATLTDSIDAEWVDTTDMPTKGDPLRQGEFILAKGAAEITFEDGAVVTVEGPAVIELESPKGMFVASGKVSAVVSGYATGFTVNTLSASIVDLGTEFGVSVEGDGSCWLYMFKGKANLIANRKGQERKSQIVNANEARSVDQMTGKVQDIVLQEKSFIRRIDSKTGLLWRGEDIDLADMVGGGNGFGMGTLDSGIDTNTGRRFESPDPELVQSKVTGILSGGGAYHEVSSLPFIDGVFVPDSRKGPVQITSAGHTFAGFVDGREVFWGNIFNGAWHASDTSFKHNLTLNGLTYGTRDNPAISMHSNQGITFDLQAIRQTIPGGRILRFTSLFGVSGTVALDPLFTPKTVGPNSGKVNCWVLIDGQERFNRNSVSYLHGAIGIDVDINDEDRFLTLVVTESDDRRAYDWALFAKPSLRIEMDMN